MKIERVDHPRYYYGLTAEEMANIRETTKIIGKLLASQPMTEDGCIIFINDKGRFYEEECNDTIDLLNRILEFKGIEFY